jgi:hypothetical protein
MADQTCPRCGMHRNDWKGNNGRGVTREGQTYCCDGCANNTGCTCR